MNTKKIKFFNKNEIKNILLNCEKLVYVDNGIDEVVVKYNDLPDFIVDMSRSMGNNCTLKVYKYPSESMTPILTTIGEFLDKCSPEVRKDIIERLIAVQTTEDTKDYKIINEDDLEKVKNDLEKKLEVQIPSVWLNDYGYINCNAIISIDGNEKANVIVEFDRQDYPDWKNSIKEYKEEIKYEWEKYLRLPKITECSRLLQEIYDNVCESDAKMCHITEKEWEDDYSSKYTNKDIEKLKEEVKNYKLEDVVTFDNDDEYKIIGWSNLELSFNDDRNLIKNRDKER